MSKNDANTDQGRHSPATDNSFYRWLRGNLDTSKTDTATAVRTAAETEQSLMCTIKPSIKFGFSVILLVVVFFGGWANFAGLDSAAIATGTVVPNTKNKTIQHLEGGIIAEILVKNGTNVLAGEPLVRLNDTYAKSRLLLLQGQLFSAIAARDRLVAERDQHSKIEFTALNNNTPLSNEQQEVIDTQQQIFNTRQHALEGQLVILKQRIAQFNDQIEGIQSQREAIKKRLQLLNEEISMVDKLLQQGLAHKPRLLSLKRHAAELSGTQGEHLSQMAKISENITEAKLHMLNIKNDRLNEVVSELKETQAQISDLSEKIQASKDTLDRTLIAAPHSGIITNIRYHTIGGVIPPGGPIMDIVPQNDKLVLEAHIAPQDIDVVAPGLQAKVMLTAYRSRYVPRLIGKVTQVSADKFTDQQSGQTYYIAQVEIDDAELERVREKVTLYPGMAAEIFIVTGQQTLMDYLMSPVTDSMRHSFKES